MKCTSCKYYNEEEKYCRGLKQKISKKKSCWCYVKKLTEVQQAFKFLRKGE